MGQPYIGEIRMVGFNWAPNGWAYCDGTLLPISENDTLFNLIGTTYGGDGQETFALPNLQGRVPIHQGTGPGGITWQLAETGGTEQETLTVQQIPSHGHPLIGSTDNGQDPNPAGNYLASSTTLRPYHLAPPDTTFAPTSIAPLGGSQPHDNMMPYTVINFIISLFGIYPSPT